MSTSEVQNPVILFDGVCRLCNRTVKFIINRDPASKFRFAPLQSETGNNLISELKPLNVNLDSIILVENSLYYVKSTAVLKILRKLGSLWPLLYVFIIVPPVIRDYIYDIVARNRYKWFGKEERCMVPNADNEKRFLV